MIKLLKVFLISICSMGFILSQELHILYTQNVNGVLQNCKCPSTPFGGMEKRATFISQSRQNYTHTLLLDSGDLLSFNDSQLENDTKMLQAMEILNYSVVNIGDQEFSNGVQFLQANIKKKSIPWVASNLKTTDNETFLVPEMHAINFADLNVLIMGVMDSASFGFYNRTLGDFNLEVFDPGESVQNVYRNALENIRVDAVILLSNLGYDRDEVLAQELDFLDVIIGGHSQHQFEEPQVINNTIITQCGKNGQYVGHLVLQFKQGKLIAHSGELIPMDLSIKDDEAMMKLISE
jgi:2',3'-cyclic-nucleotide 2'-phosphodiesterase (5'-nucleotidase family)